ncbi:hypothetical protein BBF96_15260 [Anoxybacter fermentans]|uniref:Secondary thiamine-phosphate synthase enzyme n=1 Tax=Anoxybacter fermentans TaxID=1323375 RepID=A0A3Q9HSU2_9FIRM|nr:secondary thiamine-phosphate synthase enzyme YjbQ [Anoxybacter fermentans]AZR74613.1 hypothetical protein BBF96_15260 [Anoxybacter fermentans]
MEVLKIRTTSRDELVNITGKVEALVRDKGWKEGLIHIFVPHTTAGVTINEGADPTVKADLLMILDRLVPWEGGYRHLEGNSAAHMKASLLGSSVHIPLMEGKLQLGTWQSIYLAEFDGPRDRKVYISYIPV